MAWIRGRTIPAAYVLAFLLVLAGSAGYLAYDYSGKRSICDAQGQLDVEYAFTFDDSESEFFVFEPGYSGAVYEVRTHYSPPREDLERGMIWSRVPSESYLELLVDGGRWHIHPGDDRAEFIETGTTNVSQTRNINDCAGSDVLSRP